MFLRYTKFEQLVFKLEKIVGFRNMQEKLENNLSFFNFLDMKRKLGKQMSFKGNWRKNEKRKNHNG